MRTLLTVPSPSHEDALSSQRLLDKMVEGRLSESRTLSRASVDTESEAVGTKAKGPQNGGIDSERHNATAHSDPMSQEVEAELTHSSIYRGHGDRAGKSVSTRPSTVNSGRVSVLSTYSLSDISTTTDLTLPIDTANLITRNHYEKHRKAHFKVSATSQEDASLPLSQTESLEGFVFHTGTVDESPVKERRTVGGLFIISITSKKPLPDILAEIRRVLERAKIWFNAHDETKIYCYTSMPREEIVTAWEYNDNPASIIGDEQLSFRIHVIKIPLIGMHWIRTKKVLGNEIFYQVYARSILERLDV